MAEPFYLQGTQTAGLLGGQPMPSYLPSISGAQPQYSPGYGMAPYNTMPGQDQIIQSAVQSATNANGQIDYPRLQRELGLTNEQMNQYMSQGSLSVVPGQTYGGTAQSPTGGDSPLTVIGKDNAWMSPDQLGAQTDALKGYVTGAQSQNKPQDGSAGSTGSVGSGAGSIDSGQQKSFNLSSQGGGLGGQGAEPNFGQLPSAPSGLPSNTLPGQQPQPGQPAQGLLAMTQPNAQSALSGYYNTPGYQLTEGQGAVNQFQASPGYQFAVNEAMRGVNQNASSRGLLESGSALRALSDRAQQMANLEFGNWQNRQQQMFGNYQNRLAGLAAGPTGADYAMQTGQNIGAGAMAAGNDMASLLANQGSAGFGGIMSAGGAQAGNITQAGANQAQILAANQATNLATAAQGLF